MVARTTGTPSCVAAGRSRARSWLSTSSKRLHSNKKEATSLAEILTTFDEGQKTARATLSGIDDQRMVAPWTLRQNGRVLMTVPRAGIIRSVLLNHNYHHRGQLAVYLRLLNVPVPSIYGPSADENPFADDASRELSTSIV